MSRLLLLGIGSLPIEEDERLHAPGNRIWQFAQPLLGAGHEVCVVRMEYKKQAAGGASRPRVADPQPGFRVVTAAELGEFDNDDYMGRVIHEFQPDGIVGIQASVAGRAARIAGGIPVWADIFGYHMGEAQVFSEGWSCDWSVGYQWRHYLDALLRADMLSAASHPQRHTLVGELGVAGRLNRHTVGYEFTAVIPIGRDPDCPPVTETFLRGRIVPEDAFVLYSAGGFNLWFDEETLFQGLSTAMNRDASVHFVCTGGEIPGVDRVTYARFRTRVESSPHKDRFHLLGWISTRQIPACYAESDMGVSVDRDCYETRYGSRSRITEMLRHSLPVLCTLGPEISHVVRETRCGWTFPIGDAPALAAAIAQAADNRDRLAEVAQRARACFLERFTSARTLEPFMAWAAQPWRAPDHGRANPLHQPPRRLLRQIVDRIRERTA